MFYKQIILQRGIPYEAKLPNFSVPDMSELTKEQLKVEIEKGFEGGATGQVTPAADVFTELREKYAV